MKGIKQEAAAAAAGMSVRSARQWEHGPLPSQTKSERTWRTREDPFEGVWAAEIEPLLRADTEGKLQAQTVLEELMDRYPEQFHLGQVRTLQRRFREWRALKGPDREVYFEQQHLPGQQASVDFTDGRELGVTVAGIAYVHLLFVFRVAFSGWTWATVAFGETYEALIAGIQSALWELGGSPRRLRSDNLSAATHELKRTGGRAFNGRYTAVLEHYGITPSRIQPGKSHENGIVEKAHDLLKSRLEQALQLRGSRDFTTEGEYLDFVRKQVTHLNRRAMGLMETERAALQALPDSKVPSYTTFRPKVRRWSTIRVGGRVYSVPSRLIGHEVEVRQYPDELEVRYHGHLVERMPRLRGERTARIDYRHVVWSLVQKPGAFAQYRYREELFPTPLFRAAYGAFKSSHGTRADIEYVRVLHLAASTMESAVERALQTLLMGGETFDYADVQALAAPSESEVPDIDIGEPDLRRYDALLEVSS
jgi:transposase InsO family protein